MEVGGGSCRVTFAEKPERSVLDTLKGRRVCLEQRLVVRHGGEASGQHQGAMTALERASLALLISLCVAVVVLVDLAWRVLERL